jgi:hypothetical protein
MQLFDPYVHFCFTFPMLFMFECSVRLGLLFVAEMATSSLNNLVKISIMSKKGGGTQNRGILYPPP